MVQPRKDRPFRQWADQPDNIAIEDLCQHIVSGGHLAGFVKERGFAYVTVLDWINADQKRTEMYARAREDRADVLADEIVAIADEECTMVKTDDGTGQTEVVFDSTAVARNRLRVDARKWAASKLKPRTYGDKIAVGGAEDLPAIAHTHEMTDEALMAIASGARKA